jgi:hypothetical protein
MTRDGRLVAQEVRALHREVAPKVVVPMRRKPTTWTFMSIGYPLE